MKKLVAILCLTGMLFSGSLSAQHAVGPITGPNFLIRSGSAVWWNIGGIYQYDFNQTHSIAGAAMFAISVNNNGSSMIIINPQYRYAFNSTYDGLYAGGYLKYGFVVESGGGSSYGFGGHVGYEIPLSESIILDINGNLGYSNWGVSIGSGFGRIGVGGLDLGINVAAKFLIGSQGS